MGKTALLVLAAGIGSRFGGAKQTASVGPAGETILEYSVYDALMAGFDEIVFLLGPAMEADFRARVLSRLPASLRFRVAFQETTSLLGEGSLAALRRSGRTKPWGTGHALLCAEAELGLPFASINADDYYGRESFRLVHDFLAGEGGDPAEWCMAGFRLGNTMSPNGPVSRGICSVDGAGMLLGVTERRSVRRGPAGGYEAAGEGGETLRLGGDETVSMNLWGFTPRVFSLGRPLLEEFLERNADSAEAEFGLPGLVDSLLSRGGARLRALPTPEAWFGLTYRADAADAASRVAALTAAGSYPSPLWGRSALLDRLDG
jgi:hypothetical protein